MSLYESKLYNNTFAHTRRATENLISFAQFLYGLKFAENFPSDTKRRLTSQTAPLNWLVLVVETMNYTNTCAVLCSNDSFWSTKAVSNGKVPYKAYGGQN
jgi:hypothetical protein